MATVTRLSLPPEDHPFFPSRPYEVGWDGVPFPLSDRPHLAFDAETEKVEAGTGRLPRVALLTVSDGTRTVILHPDEVGAFQAAHLEATWVAHNAQFDWWAVWSVLSRGGRAAWWESLAVGRVRDTMLLDFLVLLARGGGGSDAAFSPRGLGKVSQDYLGVGLDKADPHRLRYGELIGADWARVDWPDWGPYAARDALVTAALYPLLWEEGVRLVAGAGGGLGTEGAWRHGLLTEGLQVRASVVLSQIGRNGFGVDLEAARVARERLEAVIRVDREFLESQAPDLFSRYRMRGPWGEAGDYKTVKGTGLPHLQQEPLRALLTRVAVEQEIPPDRLPSTPKGRDLGLALGPWRALAGDHPVVQAWARMMDQSKLLQFVCKVQVGGDRVYPDYRTLVRSGRASCSQPNIMQMPREPWFRALFTAAPGHTLLIVDYSAIELVTLAAVCLGRYGESKLAEVLRAGVDPHSYTAALFTGRTYEEVLAGVKAEKAAVRAAREAGLPPPLATPYSQARQSAKALNFGTPGGLGPDRTVQYARDNYGVTISRAEAVKFKSILTREVYPEIGRYLEDDPGDRVAQALGVTREEVEARLFGGRATGWQWLGLEQLVGGVSKGGPGAGRAGVSKRDRARIWQALQALNRTPSLTWDLACWNGSGRLRRALFGATATTLTGRVRAGLDYGEARNTPFQGLAADGAKQALWDLTRTGYLTGELGRMVAFVHDEVVVEVPEAQAQEALAEVSRVMEAAMSGVLGCDIPVKTEGTVSRTWTK